MSPEVVLPAAPRFAEGPVWDAARQRLLWVDIHAGEVHRLDPAEGTDAAFAVGRPVGAVAPTRDGRLVLAVADGFARCNDDGTDLHLLAAVPPTSPGSRMNDGACDAAGRFWAGTLDRSEPGRAALHRLDPDGTASVALPGVTVSNGLAWSPDDRWMYYVDTPTLRLDRFAFDLDSGRIADRQVVAGIGRGRPDGIAVDEEGCVWVALFGGGAVLRVTPGGRIDRTIEIPAAAVTSCAFGGPDLDTLFVTTAHRGDGEGRHAGAIFAVDPHVRGTTTGVWG